MGAISTKNILTQIQNDLIGKDSYRGVTLTYAWLCNQWGHLALGFIPALFFGLFFDVSFWGINRVVVAGLSISALATLFEAYNFIVPIFMQSKKSIFTPAWGYVAFDTFTDLTFFYVGGLSATYVLKLLFSASISLIPLFILLLLVVYIMSIFKFWYTTKMYLQNAMFPFQFRLSMWTNKISKDNKEKIDDIIAHYQHRHVLIFGGGVSGKTGLAVGMASEIATKRLPVLYTTGIKIGDMFFRSDSELRAMYRTLWSWRETECVVIDDINAGEPIDDIISPKFMESLIFNDKFADVNKYSLAQKTVIWVVGDKKHEEEWVNLIHNLGVGKDTITIIEL